MGAARIVGVLAEDAEARWSEVEHWVSDAVDRDGLMGAGDVLDAIKQRDMQLWLVMAPDLCGVCVTEVCIYPKRRVLMAVATGGTGMPRWLGPLNDHLTRFARAHDCSRFMAPIARRGWRPFARALGWTERATYWKDIDVV